MKRIISLVISVLMIISTFAFSINAAEKSGVTFAVDELYRTAQRLDKHPHTYEAWVKVAKNAHISVHPTISPRARDNLPSPNPVNALKFSNPTQEKRFACPSCAES